MKIKKLATRNGRAGVREAGQKKSAQKSVVIDYPREGERMAKGHYAVRISANGHDQVEISINDGEWTSCRPSVGYFWFDWWPNTEGLHELIVRARSGQGRWKKSPSRNCIVA